jgi:hypothetical protein
MEKKTQNKFRVVKRLTPLSSKTKNVLNMAQIVSFEGVRKCRRGFGLYMLVS